MRAPVALLALALLPIAVAEPTAYHWDGAAEVLSGVATQGSRDAYLDWFAGGLGCTQSPVRFLGELVVHAPGATLTLEVDEPLGALPGSPHTRLAATHGQPARFLWEDDDSCPEVWVEGSDVLGAAAYELRLTHVDVCAIFACV